MHVFISYAKVDTYPLAKQIHEMLQRIEGVSAWMDDSLEAASSWATQIQAEIDRCDYMVVLLSPDVNRPVTETQPRSFVLHEIDYAQQERKTIVPVLAQRTRIPVQLAGIQYVDLTKNHEQGIQRLEELVRKRSGNSSTEELASPVKAAAPQARFRWLFVLIAAALFLGALIMLPSLLPPDRAITITPGEPGEETPGLGASKNDLLAADLATQIYLSQLTATSTPTLDNTQDIGTRVAWIIASETARQPTVTSTPTATPSPNLTLTNDYFNNLAAELATEMVNTQIAQLTLSIPTQMLIPTVSPTSEPSPTLTQTWTPTPTPLSANDLEATQQAQSTAIVEVAIATANAQTSEAERIRRAAFAITFAFEGGGYASYQTVDSGIITYGHFGFTLASGSLLTLIERYLEQSDSAIAAEIRSVYLSRLQNRDESLREDEHLRDLLVSAASDPLMQAAQDELATETLWNAVQELSVIPRGIQTPLGQALIFDMAINHGLANDLLQRAEQELGLSPGTSLPSGNVTEEMFITKLAEVRRDNLYGLADRLNLPGLKRRADFWVNLIAQGDWQLQGDASGNVEVGSRSIQIRNP
jgi:hypothetical protein